MNGQANFQTSVVIQYFSCKLLSCRKIECRQRFKKRERERERERERKRPQLRFRDLPNALHVGAFSRATPAH